MATVLGPWSWSKKRARKVDEKYVFKEYLEEGEEEEESSRPVARVR